MNRDYFWKERVFIASMVWGLLKLPRNLRGIHTWDKHCEPGGLFRTLADTSLAHALLQK